jgi:hypothetical protein
VTTSVSVAVQMPVAVTQPGFELVFVRPTGGVIDALLITCV